MHIDKIRQISELEREIATLPPGNISTKKVKGKVYYYHRFTTNGKRKEIYVDFDRVDEIQRQILKRKELEEQLKTIQYTLPKKKSIRIKEDMNVFRTYVIYGEHLKHIAKTVQNYKKRECFYTLHDYVFKQQNDKVFILYGLRRTGKTTMIRQLLLEMSNEQLERTAFIQVTRKDTLYDLNHDLRHLERLGYIYIFIDEVTVMEDFIEGSSLFADIYASSGMKIVLSGTDSLGFLFTKYDQLYDRCIFLHTTFIPYREFEEVLGIHGMDAYIQYGGTMSIQGVNYNKDSLFATSKSTNEYIDSAIAKNIQHSLKYYKDGNHFRHLYDLYNKNELTSAINRVIEDMNHRFTKETLIKTFKSNDLSIVSRNLLKDREHPLDLPANIDSASVTQTIKTMLEILDIEEQNVDIDDIHAYQIQEYLFLLDLIMKVDIQHIPKGNQLNHKII
ncbi:MAG: AAA family ATPase, partial [Holdemanella sp.]|nr:AAA family ATPase [Holdemanella sp.]